LAKSARTKKNNKPHVVRFGQREIETLGLAQGFWTDLYHRLMTVYWPVFFGSAALIFVVLNAIFALGHQPIANVPDDRFLDLFYFSIETLATVGYGDMHPQTEYGHLIATIEIFTGMCFLAVLTGLVFARFSRPRARFVFATQAVVTNHEGRPTLMIRTANARHNTISRATARLWLIRAERTKEGDQLRRFYDLKLERSEHPMFVLSWMLFHSIDKDSPLHGVDRVRVQRNRSAVRAQRRGARRQLGATALCPAYLCDARRALAPPLRRHHQRFAARPFPTRLQEVQRYGPRQVESRSPRRAVSS
jgi:inward rectifier potassium channel